MRSKTSGEGDFVGHGILFVSVPLPSGLRASAESVEGKHGSARSLHKQVNPEQL